jgi:hypothetical protein
VVQCQGYQPSTTISKYETASGTTLYLVRYRMPARGQTDKRGFTTKRDAEALANSVEVTKARGEDAAELILAFEVYTRLI